MLKQMKLHDVKQIVIENYLPVHSYRHKIYVNLLKYARLSII